MYADVRIRPDHGLRIQAAGLVIPPDAAFRLLSAAWLHGVRIAAADDPADVAVPAPTRFGPYGGLRIAREPLDPADVVRVNGLRCTTPARTVVDLARQPDLPAAVAGVDAVLHADVVDLERVRQVRDWLAAARVVPRRLRQTERVFGLCDPRAESPLESRARIGLVLAGLPPPAVQFEVRDAGVFVARVDLAYPERRLAIEVDGAWHGQERQLTRDRHRLNRLFAAGWKVLHFTAADIHRRSGYLVATVADALGVAMSPKVG